MGKKKKTRKKRKREAIYRCMDCGFIYSGSPGPQEECRECGSLYLECIGEDNELHGSIGFQEG